MTEHAALVERVSFRDSDHSYTLNGKRLPSVTTILGNLSKPGLPSWAANTGAAALREELKSRFVEDGLTDGAVAAVYEQDVDTLYELVRTAHHKVKNTAAAKGNVVHNAIQQYHEDFFTAEAPDEETQPLAYAAWRAFIEWWSTSGLECIATERKIAAADARYAGRLDMLCRGTWQHPEGGQPIPNALFVIDIKTSNGIYPEHVYQNAAYAKAIENELDEGVFGTKIIWLPEGCTKATVIERDYEEWERDYEMFDALLKLHPHRNALSKWLLEIKAEHGPKPIEE